MNTSTPAMPAWDQVSKRAFWDRQVPLERWRAGAAAGHRAYLPDAVAAFTPPEFAHFYGKTPFLQDWPQLRSRLPVSHQQYAAIYDLAWSQWVGHSWNLRPQEGFWQLPPRRRDFLVQAMQTPGQSIYGTAKALGMQYRRAHDHAIALMAQGFIRGRSATHAGKRQLQLLPVYR